MTAFSSHRDAASKRGRLIVIGTGIRAFGQLTMEAVAWMQQADKLFYLVNEPIAEGIIQNLNPRGAESLAGLYQEGQPRIQTYYRMVEAILTPVRAGATTVAAFYGHPGVFAFPSHESIRQARQAGYEARMLPGISAEDCLFADLGVDPAESGCQSYEATDFMIKGHRLDATSAVVLWQIGIVGDVTFKRGGYDLSALPHLVARLGQDYPMDHPVVIYEAAVLPACEPRIEWLPLGGLPAAHVSATSTLYIPPRPRV